MPGKKIAELEKLYSSVNPQFDEFQFSKVEKEITDNTNDSNSLNQSNAESGSTLTHQLDIEAESSTDDEDKTVEDTKTSHFGDG